MCLLYFIQADSSWQVRRMVKQCMKIFVLVSVYTVHSGTSWEKEKKDKKLKKKHLFKHLPDKYRYLYSMFFCLLLSISVSLSRRRPHLPVDSSMSLSVTECNWFCQGQSIAPRQGSSAGDRGCITVKLYSAYRNDTECLYVQVSVEIELFVVIQAESDLTSHLTSAVTDPMSRWNTAMGSKRANRLPAQLREAWELEQSDPLVIILMFLLHHGTLLWAQKMTLLIANRGECEAFFTKEWQESLWTMRLVVYNNNSCDN